MLQSNTLLSDISSQPSRLLSTEVKDDNNDDTTIAYTTEKNVEVIKKNHQNQLLCIFKKEQ